MKSFLLASDFLTRLRALRRPTFHIRDSNSFGVLWRWDEGEHPRVPPGSPEGGQFTSDGGGDGGGDHDLHLISHQPNEEKVKTWQDQLMARSAKAEPGSKEDGELNNMHGALSVYTNSGPGPDKTDKNISREFMFVYGGDLHLHAAVSAKLDTETKVGEIFYAGGTDHAAKVKAIDMLAANLESKGAEQINSNTFEDDADDIRAYEEAGFEKTDSTGGVVTMVRGTKGPTRGQLSKTQREAKEFSDQVRGASTASAQLLGYDPGMVAISEEPYLFHIGGETQQHSAAGSANLNTGIIKLYPKAIFSVKAVAPIMAHEIMHQKYQTVLNAYAGEKKQIEEAAKTDPNVIDPSTFELHPDYKDIYPVYDLLNHHQTDYKLIDKRAQTDGITDYSRAYWAQSAQNIPPDKRVTVQSATHETLAEMASRFVETGKLEGAPAWKSYYRDVMSAYDDLKEAGRLPHQGGLKK